LNAGANVPGTFVYTPAVGATLPTSNGQALSVTFTPTDTTNYSTATGATTINVTQATPVITWPSPSAITYGSALGAAQLNATANVPGTFVYAPPAGTVLPAGKGQTLSVNFTPTDSTDYSVVAGSTTIEVNSALPPGVNLVVSYALSRSPGNITILVTVANNGGTTAANAVLSTVKVGTATATPLPQNLGPIAGGSSVQATVTVPATVGASGAASSISISGTYTGGSFSTAGRITLP
jgi:hypothetical protein